MKKILPILLLSMMVMVGCADSFFDINQSPNSAVEENMTPNLILPRALHRTAEKSATGYAVYMRWLGYWSRSGTYGPNADEEAYALSSSFMRGSWLDWYDILKDFDVIEKDAKLREETAYVAIAKIMKTVGFMHLVDQYNNVPYSKAFDLENNLLTPYDKGEDIYKDLIAQLDSADVLLKNASVDDNFDITSADIMFGGDLDMWRKLGNSQRLRLLIHQTNYMETSALKAEIDKIVANGAGFLSEGETAAVNPSYSADTDKQNPFWNTYKINASGGTDNFNRANNYFLDLLSNNGDIRYQYFYSEASSPTGGANYYGFDYGYVGEDKPASESSDVCGTGPGKYDRSRGLGLGKGPGMDMWLFTSFESMFLQAEAIQRGLLAGNAKDMYEKAVTESFVWLDVIDAEDEADDYLNSSVATFAKWDSNSDKLTLILTQKYISMCGINGLETYNDYRRTGIPNVPMSVHPARGTNVIPKRLIYPLEEYQYNSANALAEGTINPQSSKVFWNK